MSDSTPARGRFRRLSLQRRLMADLMAASFRTPIIAGERLLRVGEAAKARRSFPKAPGWTAIILKAFAIVSTRRPLLRQVRVSFPFPHLYEHPVSVATVLIEREWHGEGGVFFDQIVAPEKLSLGELDTIIRGLRDRPIESVGGFRRMLRFTKYPLPLRRLLWWLGLRGSGYLHARYFGTFSVNSISLPRSRMVQTTTPITISLIHMPLEPSDQIRLSAAFDHRVLDGMEVGRALGEVETVINREIVAELRAMAAERAAAAPAAADPAR